PVCPAGPWAPAGPVAPLGPCWFQASARSPERQAEAFATTRRAPPSTLRQAWVTPFLSGVAAGAPPASPTAAIANVTRIFERMLLLPSIWHAPVIALRFARECDRAGTGTDPRKR